MELDGGIPFVSDEDLETELDKGGVPPNTADAIVDENADARIDGLRTSLSLLAIIALIALVFSRRIPTRQPSSVRVSANLRRDRQSSSHARPMRLFNLVE